MQYRGNGGGMSARHLKVRDPRHLLDSPPRVPDAAPPGTPCDSPPPASPVSVAAVVMANSVEGAALQPSRQPAASEVEVAAGKEERRPSEPVSKKRRLLQAQDESQDILAKVISEVGIDDDSNLVEGEMEEQPIPGPVEGVMGLPYTNDVRPPPPGLPLPPRLRVADPRMRPTFPYQTMEGPYVMRGLRPPYPHYAPRPIDLLAQQGPPPQYRPVYPPGPYQRLPPPPSQAIARLPLVRPSDRHLPPRHVSPSVPRHFRPPPLHTSPPGPPPLRQTHGVHHVFAAPSHRPLPGSSPESPTHLYPGPPVPRPELKDSHLREVYVPVLSLPGGPYANLHPRIPEGFTRVPFDPRAAPRREGAPHQMVVTSRLPPRPVYTSERLPGTEPALRPQPTGDDSWRPTRRVIEPPPPCVELIPLGPLRSSTATTSLSEDGRVSGLDNKPSGSSPPPEPRPQQVGVECRRQSAPAQNDQCSRPSLAQRSLSSGTPLGDTVKAAPLVEALQVDGRVVTNIITGDRVYKGRHVPFKRIKKTTKSSEEETRPSSSNNDATVEKEVCIDRDGGVVTPQSGLPAACDDTDSHLSQPTRTSRPASEPPPVTMAPPVTGRRPASVPAAGTTSVPCPRGEILEDAAFTERLQLVLNDLVSVPGATQLQELSRSPARLLSTVLRRWGVQPSTHPDLQKRLREDFKTMVKLCMPPTLLQDFGWESCTSEEILTQLIQLSQNGDLERPSSMTSSIPLDETLDDDVFSPSTPHSQPLHPSPSASQPSQPPPPTSHPSQPPPASQSSHPSSPASQPSQPPSPASQPSQPPPPVPKLSQTSPSASQSPQPPPLAPQSSQPSPLASQSSQPPSPALHPLQPQPPGSQPSRTLPSASHSSQPPSPASQSSQPQVPALKFSQPPSPASQPSQSPSPASQPPQPPPPASQSSQPPPPALQPSRSSPPALQPSQPPPPSPQSSQPPPLASHPYQPQPVAPQASVPHLSSPPASKHLPSPTLPSRPSHLSLSSPQPPYPPPPLQSPTSRPTHLPQHIFQPPHHPAPFTQPPANHQTHTTQVTHIQSSTSQPSHFPLVSRHSYPPQLTSQPLPLASRPTHPPVARQTVPHSSQPTHLPPQIQQAAYHHSHSSRPPPLSLGSPQPLPHSPNPTQTSPHSPHTIPHFPTKADKLSYSRFQYHTQPYPRPLAFRFPTSPSQPQPPLGVRNTAITPPGSLENFHQHLRHQHQQQQQQQQHQPVRFPSEKWIGGDDVAMPKVHNTANGQASPRPPNEGLPS